jgi:hypothetical protein
VEVGHINRSSAATHHPNVYTSTIILCQGVSGRLPVVLDVSSILSAALLNWV